MPGQSGGNKIRWEEKVVRLAGFEPTTPGSASQCSNPLSYKRKLAASYQHSKGPAPAGALSLLALLVPREGFEPTHP